MNINTNLDCQINETTIVCWHQFNPTSIILSGQNSLTLQFTSESLTVLTQLIKRLEDIKNHLLSKKQQELDNLVKNNSVFTESSLTHQTVTKNGHLSLIEDENDIPF